MSKNQRNIARFSGLGIQMGVIIGGFAWLGNYLDKKQGNNKPWWTLSLLLFGVIGAMYLVIKEIKQMNEDE